MIVSSVSPENPALVFVHLGKNPAPTLIPMAKIANTYFPEAVCLLITDRVFDWLDFPGEVVEYSKEQRSAKFKEFSQRHPELEGISGGYWLYTTERIFCLSILGNFLNPRTPVIHLESDVYSTIDEMIFNSFLSECKPGTWVPRYSAKRGIGSTIFSTSVSILLEDLTALEALITSNPEIDNDMDLLGKALNLKILKELPTLTKPLQEPGPGEQILFDALAIGQYIFGQDPLHTDGVRVSGYRNPDSDFNFERTDFFLDFSKNSKGRLAAKFDGGNFQFATLHLHSKITPKTITQDIQLWKEAVAAANTGVKLISEERYPDIIHSQRISLLNKLRRARKVGLINYVRRVLRFRMTTLIGKFKKRHGDTGQI